ncbi:MAG: methyltransferase domain-containing protein [Robiginitomaculum sp.]|nr:methyltransferase domain-containing protein [Robiginitomaculum sp.]
MNKKFENKNRPKAKTHTAKTPKHGARYVAAHGVREVLVDGTPLDIALSSQALFVQLERRDRAFARLIAATVFRRMGQIDKVLAPFVKKTPTDYALAVLRTGAAQILFLDTPAYAAVNASVALLRRSKKTAHMAGMANAVLRRVTEQGPTLLAETSTLDNIPKWLRTSWTEAYGAEACGQMAEMLAKEPPLDLTPKLGIDGPAGEILPGGTIRLAKAGDVRALAGYDDGDWWVQDISAALPVRLLGDIKGKRVLDMCAAPGGKTLQLAAAGANVTALDKNQDRLERVKENLARTKLSAEIVVGDAAKWRDPENPSGHGFDIVILDAPCTATGTFRRRPDVLYSKRPADIESLARIQEKLLMAAARHVAPGGTLVYCTCSLQKREGEEQISKFMQNRTDFRLNSLLGMDALGMSEAATAEGMFRVLPHYLREKGGMDGFFIATFTRC